MMNRLLKISVILILSFSAFLCDAQTGLQMKLQLLPDGESWGVYVKPEGISPTGSTTTASGQVTVIMPLGFDWQNLDSHAGQWINSVYATSPMELPGKQIIAFGLVQAEPLFPIQIQENEETLLFSFSSTGPCPDTLYLADCVSALSMEPNPDVSPICPEFDDFNFPFCYIGNPGNDLGMLDYGVGPPQQYNFEGNYNLSAWNCHDCDGDGIPNGLEETPDACVYCTVDNFFTLQPEEVATCTGSSAQFNCEVNESLDAVISAVWQKKNGIGGGWEDINEFTNNGIYSGYDSSTLEVSDVTGLGTYCFRRKFTTQSCAYVVSEEACLELTGPISLESPLDRQTCEYGSVLFEAKVIDLSPDFDSNEHINLHWQSSGDFGTTWDDMVNGYPFEGVFTEQLKIDATIGLDSFLFRLVIHSDYCDNIYSAPALLTYVESSLNLISQPGTIVSCVESELDIEILYENLNGTETNYLWEKSCDDGASWEEINYFGANNFLGFQSGKLTIGNVTHDLDSCLFRSTIWNEGCDTLVSDVIPFFTDDNIEFQVDLEEEIVACVGDDICLQVETSGGNLSNLTYRWEYRDVTDNWWKLASVGTDNFICLDNLDMTKNGAWYRVKVESDNCQAAQSDIAELDVIDGICTYEPGIHMSLKLMPGGGRWGVYARPTGINVEGETTTASGYATVNMPVDFNWSNLENFNGMWWNHVTISAPMENPDRKYVSFGIVQTEPLFPIELNNDIETLLFTFESEDCPDSLYLVDCNTSEITDPFCPYFPDSSPNTNSENALIGTQLSGIAFDVSPPFQYGFSSLYEPFAWNCHDCDNDGIPNAFDENCTPREKLNFKLSYNSIYESWSIMATPGVDFLPTENSILESARLTIVSSDDFEPNNIHSLNGGDWELISEFEEDDIRYFTFELKADLEPIDFEYGQEVKFFRFKNELGDCPESLSILEGSHPANVHANELYGTSMEGAESVEVGFGENYGPNAWQCEIILGGGFGLDSLGTSEPVEKMFVSPNPASDFINVNISAESSDIQSTIKLTSLRGQTLQTHLAEGQNTLQLDLNHLPAGLYILTLEREGRVVQREKLIKE